MDEEENNDLSADDILEEARQTKDDSIKVGMAGLEEDNDRPAAPPDPIDSGTAIPQDHPITDTGQDTSEIYNQGLRFPNE